MNDIISEEIIYNGKIITVKKETLLLPNNCQVTREFVHHAKAVGIVAIHNNNLLLVKQYRTGIKDYMIEIPAGLLEENESPTECAIRELREETGYEPQDLIFLGEYYLSPGFCDESIFIFVADNLIYNPKNPDDDEFIEIIKLPLSNIYDNIFKEISNQRLNLDAKTILGISLYLLYIQKHHIN